MYRQHFGLYIKYKQGWGAVKDSTRSAVNGHYNDINELQLNTALKNIANVARVSAKMYQ